MYTLSKDKLVVLMTGIVEGQSLRSLERMTGVHRDTIARWLVRVGAGCQQITDKLVRNVSVRYVQADEMWSFIGKKDNNIEFMGDVSNGYKGEAWTFVAIGADSKLILSYALGNRNQETSYRFLRDLRGRIAGPFQLTTDGFPGYVAAAYQTLLQMTDVDFGQLVKVYSGDRVVGTKPTVIFGKPNMRKISTSYVERQNLTVRMNSKRFSRKTIAFSKKAANHLAAMQLHLACYNFVRVHRTLKMPPALAAGITDHVWTMEKLVAPAYHGFAERN
jgi:IS1 family transposase